MTHITNQADETLQMSLTHRYLRYRHSQGSVNMTAMSQCCSDQKLTLEFTGQIKITAFRLLLSVTQSTRTMKLRVICSAKTSVPHLPDNTVSPPSRPHKFSVFIVYPRTPYSSKIHRTVLDTKQAALQCRQQQHRNTS